MRRRELAGWSRIAVALAFGWTTSLYPAFAQQSAPDAGAPAAQSPAAQSPAAQPPAAPPAPPPDAAAQTAPPAAPPAAPPRQEVLLEEIRDALRAKG